MTIVVNLLAGSGAGKSTNAARLFAMLKELGVEVELATEYVKDMVWEGRTKIFDCQPYIFGKQLYKLVRLQDKVDVVITDCPIVLSALYDPEQDPDFKRFVFTKFNQFKNLNFFLQRSTKYFNPNGRNEKTLSEAMANDNKLLTMLYDNEVPYSLVNADESGCRIMRNIIMYQLGRSDEVPNDRSVKDVDYCD